MKPFQGSGASFRKGVEGMERRKLQAEKRKVRTVWLGLGMFGLVGWSVAVPAVAGAFLGAWIDRHYRSTHSWTLALLVAGLTLGCWNAWRWIAKEELAIREETNDN